ncbi:MAG: hypothetical protein GW795_13285 [Cyanobacteria bacterium]|nr:hypothetical protein [Cyanobacteria bacterium CG_2015-16_32_12]NCO76818.1 hypothetical protein [Cyanobacteria bacterium CG_2015-22_32_23]NCQ05057.1 hypothetical protein [Cyanobacteria bacterium CG_2015-09_32_10]NCQ42813.1 hypothetical protein [Cyanobacteria bacterium CG_2015-04_32_10]NCS85487.1 hypothetical protein [Cyanobacteria bacterium CG_2015-02_32_10]
MTPKITESDLTFDNILNLVRKLPTSEQIKLSQTIAQETQSNIEYRTKTFESLLRQVKPVTVDFDIDKAKQDYFQEKYNL